MSINITFSDTVTSYKIYFEVLPKIADIYDEKVHLIDMDILQLDMYEVEDIDSLAIPNLVAIAELLRKDFKKIILILPYKEKPKRVLYSFCFTTDEYLRDLFTLETDDIGGISDYIKDAKIEYFDYFKINATKDIIETNINDFFNKQAANSNKEGIIRVLQNAVYDVKKNYNLKSYTNEEQEMVWLLNNVFISVYKVIIELITNACFHGESKCLFMYHYDRDYKRILFSIVDTGNGFSESFSRKEDDDKELSFINRSDFINYDKDLLYIIEAVSYRFYRTGFGIYDAAKIVSSLNGKIRYHYRTTQCLFTPDLFKKISKKDDFKLIIDKFQKEITATDKSNKYKQARKTKDFKGIHVEIEIPLDNYDWRIFKDVINQYFRNK